MTRNNLIAAALRAEAARTKNTWQARRMLAIAMVLDDQPRRNRLRRG
jgi:hypothetical protein